MPGNRRNLYQMARKEGTYTQEQAANLLHVSDTTLKEWEQGRRTPDNPMVSRMAEVYHAPWLRVERALEIFSELGITEAGRAPANLQSAVLDHYALTLELMDGYRRFIQITADGIIDESERADCDLIQSVILRNCIAGLRLACCQEVPDTKKERPEAATSKRSGLSFRAEPTQHGHYSTRTAVCARPNFAKTGGDLL